MRVGGSARGARVSLVRSPEDLEIWEIVVSEKIGQWALLAFRPSPP